MLGESPNPLYEQSRDALLDVLDALGEHADRVVLVGAQAIYLRCQGTRLAIAPYTKDADIALIPPLGTEPALEDAMRAAGLEQRGNEPGIWVREGAEVDLLVPVPSLILRADGDHASRVTAQPQPARCPGSRARPSMRT